MKTLLLTLLFPLALFAAEQTITMNVAGNCGMCKKKIEKAAMVVPGVNKATWNKTTKVLTVELEDTLATKELVSKAVRSAGYDVDSTKATDADYEKLADCCKYRK